MVSVAATRYARALAEVVLAQGSGLQAISVADQLKRMEDLLAVSPDLRHVLNSPAVANAKKRAVIGKLAGSLGLDNKVRNFLYVVIDHHRMHQISEIREAFEAVMDRELGLVRAEVTSAQPLDEAQQTTVRSRLEKLTGKVIRATYGVDGSLIGGVLARVGSTVYDGSVRGQLDGLRRKLITES
jgi:F-type H+-transporting ATPase subunit delta